MEMSAPSFQAETGFSSRKRWLARADLAASVFLAVYSAALLNIIIFRHPVRIDLTEEGLHSLSDETRAKLDLVREEIRVIVPYYQQPRNAQHIVEGEVLNRAVELLKEFNAEQPLVRLVAKVDIYAEPDRWAGLREEYGLSETDVNRLVLIAGEGKGKGAYRQSLTPADLAIIGERRDAAVAPQIRAFRGERAITGAIVKLVNRDRKKVYFVTGHGEIPLRPGPRGSASGAEALPGLGPLRHDLESSGFEPIELSLLEVRRVPADCALLVVAGPRSAFSPREIDVLERYLLEDGRLFAALSTERTGLEDLLARWGVKARDHRLRARITVPGEEIVRSWVPVGEYNGAHPVTRPFDKVFRFHMLLWTPRPLEITGGQGTFKTEPLFSTGPETDRERFEVLGGGLPPDDATREKGFILATATYPSYSGRPPPGWEERKTRIVVVGASNFLRDVDQHSGVRGGYLSASHRDFFMNALYWLAGDESLLAAGGRDVEKRVLPPMTSELGLFLGLAAIVIFPGVFALLGMGIYFVRRA